MGGSLFFSFEFLKLLKNFTTNCCCNQGALYSDKDISHRIMWYTLYSMTAAVLFPQDAAMNGEVIHPNHSPLTKYFVY